MMAAVMLVEAIAAMARPSEANIAFRKAAFRETRKWNERKTRCCSVNAELKCEANSKSRTHPH